jgi:hypothetical protein
MRKLIWGSTIAGVATASSFLSLAYYACSYPDTAVGRGMFAVADVSLAIHPLHGMYNTTQVPPSDRAGGAEECIPEDPKPVVEEKVQNLGGEIARVQENIGIEADIVIPEENLAQGTQAAQGGEAGVDAEVASELPAGNGPLPMPKCQEGAEQAAKPPRMPYADEGVERTADAKKKAEPSKEEQATVFEAWKSLFESGESKSSNTEVLPYPMEEEEAEPKCEEDPHRHEQFSGSARTTCPYTGKSYPSVPSKSAGKEESSEEPPAQPRKSRAFQNDKTKAKDDVPHAAGVDTMEFRKSDAGQNLNDYGPGPIH